MRLAIATTNRHKIEEILAILGNLGVEGVVPDTLPHVEETGHTFEANARLKAASAARHLGLPALADDSGLVVPALGGEPGVTSARYAGPEATAEENNARLVRRLERLGIPDPAAYFVCHAVILRPNGDRIAEAEGRVDGVIRWPGRGEGGFGYDPLFHHPESGCRMSELEREAKNAVSHRGRALRALAAELARFQAE